MNTPLIPKTSQDFACLDHVAAAVFAVALDHRGLPCYVAMNAFGLAQSRRPLSDYIGRTCEEVYGGEEARLATSRHAQVLKDGRPDTYQLELKVNGRDRALRTTLHPATGPDGMVAYLVGTSLDVTIEKDLHRAEVTMTNVSAEMEQFISLAAHDLRTPMRNVGFLSEMLRENFEDRGDGKLELINMLDDVAKKANALISDVLAHAKATMNRTNADTFSLAELCRDISDVLDPRRMHCFDIEEAIIHGERPAFQIVLRNLLDNAIKHGQRNNMLISVRCTPLNSEQVQVVISDNGRGFDNPANAFINSGNFRVDSGYGLLGIRRLIQARGGNIAARNHPSGHGSEITFSLAGVWLQSDAQQPNSPAMPLNKRSA